MLKFDVVVVGGGIIGTAVARQLLKKYPHLKLAIVEKESDFAKHQSGHNSGVIHSGIYYTPGTMKAKLCVEGLNLAYQYCDEKQIPYKRCGKLIVAVNKEEIPKLHFLYERGKKNEVKDLSLIESSKIKEIEPNCQGIAALWSPNTGIVDWAAVNKMFAKDCQELGAEVFFNFYVTKFSTMWGNYPIVVGGNWLDLCSKFVVTCAGLFSDRLAFLTGCSPEPRIIPVRGDYLILKPEKQGLVKTNIYPVPNTKLPFLDVHFTPRMDGNVWIGPNAIVSLKREGYKATDINILDALDVLFYRGSRKLMFNHWSYGLNQVVERLSTYRLITRLNSYVPKLQVEDVIRGPSGVRAQALNKSGELVDDFVFDCGTGLFKDRCLHVRNAPSPAATSSLAIAQIVVNEIERKFTCNHK